MHSKIVCSVAFVFVITPGARAVAPPARPLEFVAPQEAARLKELNQQLDEHVKRLKKAEQDIARLQGINAELDDATRKWKALETEKRRLSLLAEKKQAELMGINEQLAATRGKLEDATEQAKKDQEQERIFMAFCILVIAAAAFGLGNSIRKRP